MYLKFSSCLSVFFYTPPFFYQRFNDIAEFCFHPFCCYRANINIALITYDVLNDIVKIKKPAVAMMENRSGHYRQMAR